VPSTESAAGVLPVKGSAPTSVTLIVPCYNEEAGIDHLISHLHRSREFHRRRYDLQFLLVDDGSSDQTYPRLVAATRALPQFTVIQHSYNAGITEAIMTGLRAAQTDIAATLDADCTYDPCQVGELLACLKPGVDLVTASPYHPHGLVENVPAWRLKLSHTCSWLYRRAMRTRLWTYTSCFRVYRRRAFLHFAPKHPGFVGLVEMLHWLEQRGGSIVECPATLRVRQFGQSKMRAMRVAREHLRFMAGCCLRTS
jgi:dolichol-phosphate mannosyltransferase